MRSSFAATSLELEAERRREVVESDLGPRQPRATVAGIGHRILSRAPAGIARLTNAGTGSHADRSEASARCTHPVGAVRPGS